MDETCSSCQFEILVQQLLFWKIGVLQSRTAIRKSVLELEACPQSRHDSWNLHKLYLPAVITIQKLSHSWIGCWTEIKLNQHQKTQRYFENSFGSIEEKPNSRWTDSSWGHKSWRFIHKNKIEKNVTLR